MKQICPLIKDECLEHGCLWFIQLQGKHPQTGQPVNEWGCSIAWLPVLLIENAKEVRQGAAAVESFRNETVTASGAIAGQLSRVAEVAAMARLSDGVKTFQG